MSTLYYESSISHHGIKGQKWGVRRYQNPDGTLTAAGRKRNRVELGSADRKLNTNRFKEGSKRLGSDFLIHVAYQLIPGASLIGLATVGAQGTKSLVTKHTDFTKKDGDIETVKDLKKLSKPEMAEESLHKINPSNMGLKTGTDINCASCAVAMDMRQKGYDVRARRQNGGLTNYQIADLYKDGAPKAIPGSKRDNPQMAFDHVWDTISADNNGNSSGVLCMAWRDHGGLSSGGHAIYYKCIDHKVEFYDGQVGKSGSKIDSYFVNAQPDKFSYVRTDHLKPNDSIGYCVISYDRERDDNE